jgi:hypothetical protein
VADAPTIQAALAKVKRAIGAVGKNDRNTVQNFSFRGIDAVVNAAAPHLNEQGIITVPRMNNYTYGTVEVGRNNTKMGHVIVNVTYVFVGPAGDEIVATVLAEAMDSGDKAVPKAMSVAYRIALLQVLNLPTDEPDPDSESYERSGAVTQSGAVTRIRTSAEKPKSAKIPHNVNILDFVTSGQKASDVEKLRTVYKAAGTAGALQTEVAHPDTGEKMTLEKYLLKKHDDLTFAKADKALHDAEMV